MLIRKVQSNSSGLLLLISRDVEINPGPNSQEYSISILHLNIRSVRQSIEYITDSFLDFDILCFTETHLNQEIPMDNLLLDNFSMPFRKGRNNRGGGILVYIKNNVFCEWASELETSWDERIWVKIHQQRQKIY